MKKIIGLALVAGCLAAMPVMAQAAEFPAVDIATKCEYANGHTGFKKDDRPDEITMKKLILTETEADGFTASAKFVFTAEGKMQFAEKEKTVVENGSVKAECYAEEGKLIVQILAADDKKQEALTLSDYTLDAENGALEFGSGVHYGLYADYADANGKAERTKVVENFVDALEVVRDGVSKSNASASSTLIQNPHFSNQAANRQCQKHNANGWQHRNQAALGKHCIQKLNSQRAVHAAINSLHYLCDAVSLQSY